jgi:signal transduction histidine kinase
VTGDREPDRLAVLVHEVRSPVAALAAIAAVFGDASVDTSERRELAGLALGASRGIERIVADAAVSSIRLAPVDLGRLVREAAAAGSLLGSAVRAVVPGQATIVRADAVRLRQGLDNLVGNAARHARGEEVVITLEDTGHGVRISVSDRGPGVAAADRERIFERGVAVGEHAGTGLGLAVTRAIAVAHGGLLTVASTPGVGSTFTLSLPAA